MDAAIAAGDAVGARALLGDYWRQSPDLPGAAFVVGRFEEIKSALRLPVCRLAILRSFTVEPLIPLLRAAAFDAGIDLDVHLGEFGAYTQEILDPKSRLYGHKPEVVILAVQTRDLSPDLWERFADLNEQAVDAAVHQASQSLCDLVRQFRAHSGASLIVHTLASPAQLTLGVLDAQMAMGQSAGIDRVNTALAAQAHQLEGVYLLDYASLVARFGEQAWSDERKWLTARMPVSADHLIHLAREWMKFLHPLTGKVCKALVMDLDNTLWGGVIGEDGMEGIKVGAEYPGVAYLALQRAILDLYHRGVILAVCSKNNPADAMQVLKEHPGMLLRPDHFAVLRINWDDKAKNLMEVARELDIGMDALAFMDDNPVECQWVRQELPQVTIIQLPNDPMQFAPTLRGSPVFERLRQTQEDKQRGKYYVQERQRTELEQSTGSLEDFYRSLEMHAEVAPVDRMTLARTAQLTQKTNQFNLTTRRYSEQEIAALSAAKDSRVYTMSVRDRFGDSGLVGVAVLKLNGADAEIDTFLMSCRVIGRTIETAFLATLARHAQAAGAKRLTGWFLPTKKNAPSKDFYPSHRFEPIAEAEEGTRWAIVLPSPTLTAPAWIDLKSSP